MTSCESTKPADDNGLLARLGNVTSATARTFWFIGREEADFEAASDLIEGLRARHPRVDMLLTAPQPAIRAWLRTRFPQSIVLPPPLPFAPICGRYIVNLNVRGIAILGALGRSEQVFLKAASGRALPVVLVEGPAGRVAALSGAVPQELGHHFVLSDESRDRLLAGGVEGERITRLAGDSATRTDAFVETVSRLLTLDLKLIRSKVRPIRRKIERLGLHLMGDPHLRRLLAAKARRYDSLEGLRAALGNPQTILCLGNGPSSEDASVSGVAHDCLFRVNDLWLKRGLLIHPDMVFTGSKGTLVLVKGAIFGLHTIKSEARLLVAPLFRLPRWGFRYATIERFGLFLSEPRWDDMRPTNGAVMLATAVALQPARLVISGIDLFSHPAGTYPGDTQTPNAYTPGHNADSELALLLEALDRYRGELVILSPALRERWEAFRDGPRQRPEKRLGDAG